MMNTTAIEDFRGIWRATTVQRDRRSMMQLGWLALTLAVLGELGAGAIVLKHQQDPLLLLRVLSGIAAGWLGLVWTMLFVPASILLNSPANARLVPRQRRRLIQMAVAGWLLVTAGMTAAAADWAVIPAVGLGLIGFALMRGGRNEATPLFIISINWPSLSRHVLPPAVVEVVSSGAGLMVLGVLLAPAGAWALRTMYPAGGDSHMARRGEQIKRAAWFGREAWDYAGEGGRLSGWTNVQVYRAMFRRALRRPRPGPMLMHALGPAAHWSAWIGAVVLMLVVSAGLRLVLAWRGEAAMHDFIGGALGSGLVAMVIVILFSTVVFSQQMRKTGGEQSLLRLTPLAGEAALLNRRLARELLRNTLRNWVVLTALILLSTIIVGAGREIVLREAAMCVLAGQVATMGLLGDFADGGGWNVARAVQAGLLAVVEMIVAMILARTGVASTWTWLSAIAVAVGAVLLVRAWRKMLAAPPAFPAGRMG
jgi:hypothetical protein